MSRSNNNTNTNPVTRWFEWSGSTGQMKYYDRDTKENIFVDLPFSFMVLDQLSTVTGYSDEAQSGIWANEVRNVRQEELTVRTKLGVAGRGLYESVKSINGARYTKSIYIAFVGEDGELLMGNIKAVGAFLSAWIEFCKHTSVLKGCVTVSQATPKKKGATKYFVPEFKHDSEVSFELEQEAIALDKKLQDYLKAYFSTDEFAPTTSPEEFEELELVADERDDEIPF